jgi:hypothetical protein
MRPVEDSLVGFTFFSLTSHCLCLRLYNVHETVTSEQRIRNDLEENGCVLMVAKSLHFWENV